MYDIIIVSVPGTLSAWPPAAPAVLKSAVTAAGFSCITIDYNIKLFDESYSAEFRNYFATGLDFKFQQTAENLIEQWSLELISLNPKFIGLSVFTYQNQLAAELFCKFIKKHSNIKIVIGGQGIAAGGIQGPMSWAENLKNKNLIDFYIRSEGEISLVELLKGNISYPGICRSDFLQIDNLDQNSIPNYDDYVLSKYNPLHLPVTGSRGCVRSCTFCDIHEHWKFRFRSGENIANEIIELNKKYKINNFYFTDSLVNGNHKEFLKFIEILSTYNKNSGNKIYWGGQFIIRSVSQCPEQYWKTLAESGAQDLSIGVETGSDSVRQHMRKNFTNQDLDYSVNMLHKHGITCTFLMIVGYPTETEEDFNQTLEMFVRYQPMANTTIRNISFGSTLGVLPGTDLHTNAELYHLELDRHENNWISLDNPNLTLEVRIHRRRQAIEHVRSLGYKINDHFDSMMKILEDNVESFNQRNHIKKMIRLKQQTKS